MLSLSLLLYSGAAVTGILQSESNICRATRGSLTVKRRLLIRLLSLPPCLANDKIEIHPEFREFIIVFRLNRKTMCNISIIERSLPLHWTHLDVFLEECFIDAGFVF